MCMVAQTTYIVTAKSLRVRQMPSAESTVLGSLTQGAEVTVQSILDDWAIISYKGATAYTSAAYLTPKVEQTTPNDESEFATVGAEPNDASEFAIASTTPNDASEFADASHIASGSKGQSKDLRTRHIGRRWLGFGVGYCFLNAKGNDKLTHGLNFGLKTNMELGHSHIGIFGTAQGGFSFLKSDQVYMNVNLLFDAGPSVIFNLGERSSGYLYCTPAGVIVTIPDSELKGSKTDACYSCGFGMGVASKWLVLNLGYNLMIKDGKYGGGMFQAGVTINFYHE